MAAESPHFSKQPFPEKLFRVVNDPASDHLIHWADDTSFRIVSTSVDEFTAKILPLLCKSNSMCSLIRQLNAYSFQKVGKSDEVVFRHDEFVRGSDSVTMMRRRRPNKRRPASGDADKPATPSASVSPAPAPAPTSRASSTSAGPSHASAAPVMAAPPALAATPSAIPAPAAAAAAADTAMRDALIAAVGCMQDMAAAVRHIAAATESGAGAEAVRGTAIASAGTASAALRRFLAAVNPSVPAYMRREMPPAAGTPGPGGSAPVTPVAELDAADRVLSGLIAAVATNQLRAPAATPAPARLGLPGGLATRGEETYTSVEDADLGLGAAGEGRAGKRQGVARTSASLDHAQEDAQSRTASASVLSGATARLHQDDVLAWGGAAAGPAPVRLPSLLGDGEDDADGAGAPGGSAPGSGLVADDAFDDLLSLDGDDPSLRGPGLA